MLTPISDRDPGDETAEAPERRLFEVKAWVRVWAKDELEAVDIATEITDAIPASVGLGNVGVEGEGAVYEVEDA